MLMANSVYVRTQEIKQKVHANFRGCNTRSGKMFPVGIGDHEIFRRKHAFADAGRRGEDSAILKPNRQIPFTGDDKTTFTHPSPGLANIGTKLRFSPGVALFL